MNKFHFLSHTNKENRWESNSKSYQTTPSVHHTRWRQGDWPTLVTSIINTLTPDPPTSFPPPYYHRVARRNVCLPPLIEDNQIKPNWCLWGKQSSLTIPACKHAKTPDTNGVRGLIYCRPLIKCVWWVHFSTKPLWNPPLLQGGAPKTNLGKDTTPYTPQSVPLLCETPHMVEWMPNDVCDTHKLHTQR